MRVLMVWDGDYPWDIRVEKVCRTLIANDHKVDLVCRNSHRRARREVIDGLNIRRVAQLSTALPNGLNAAFTFPIFLSPIWLREMVVAARECRPDLVLVRDLPMAPAAVWLARKLGVPSVLDMAECYPEMIRAAWQFEPFRVSNLIVRNPWIADLVERWVLRRVSQVWVMIEESGERLKRMGVSPAKLRIVSNTPRVSIFGSARTIEDRGPVSPLQIVYVGLLNPSRGLDIVLRAVALTVSRGGAVRLDIYGEGKASKHLRALSRSLALEHSVKFHGWVDSGLVPNIVRSADVGIVPHRQCSHWNNTIPNKLFDYMAAGVPVIVTDVKPAARIVDECDCGLIYASDSAEELASRIEALRDLGLRRTLGVNGRQAVEQRYNWEVDEQTLLASAQQLGDRHGC